MRYMLSQLLERQVVLLDSNGDSLFVCDTPALLYRHPGLHPADILRVTAVRPTQAITKRHSGAYCSVLLMSTQARRCVGTCLGAPTGVCLQRRRVIW